MATVCIPKLTFRIHDNAMLKVSNVCVVILQSERFPTHDYRQSKQNKCWSYHQFNLLLQTLIAHRDDLKIPLHVLAVENSSLASLFRQLKNRFPNCATDHTADPVFDELNSTLAEVYGDKLKVFCTQTLLDWREPAHLRVLERYWSKAKPFSKLTPIKRHVTQHLSKSTAASQMESRGAESKTTTDLPESLRKYLVDPAKMLDRVQREMLAKNMFPHDFSFADLAGRNYDQRLLRHARQKIDRIDSEKWYKPDTAPAINWGCHAEHRQTNTTQLSPFLSIGSLSPKTFWQSIQNPNRDTGSLKDQLLWRECFYATAIASRLLDGRISHFWDANPSKFIDPKPYDWRVTPEALERWHFGRLNRDQDGFDAKDTNEAMCQLYQNGWIHHLRRHLVADVLTRGQLGQHWLEGEAWFRHTLLDHDAPLNRANWMWLSAVAFSSKQKVYHYSPKDYVTRRSQDTGNITCD